MNAIPHTSNSGAGEMILTNVAQGTHIVPLAKALVATTGPVLEVGMGEWSTPFLIRYCHAAGRALMSLDHVQKWADAYNDHAGANCHRVDYDEALPKLAKKPWSVVLIDNRPSERRLPDTLRFRTTAEYILVHDAHDYTAQFSPQVRSGWSSSWVEADTLVLKR